MLLLWCGGAFVSMVVSLGLRVSPIGFINFAKEMLVDSPGLVS